MANLPQSLNPDTIPVLLSKQLGIQLRGDAELNLLAEMSQRPCDQISSAAVTTAATNAGFASPDITMITTALDDTDLATA